MSSSPADAFSEAYRLAYAASRSIALARGMRGGDVHTYAHRFGTAAGNAAVRAAQAREAREKLLVAGEGADHINREASRSS